MIRSDNTTTAGHALLARDDYGLGNRLTPEAIAAAIAESPPDPTLFVCTNGARDACCALKGRALLDALPDSVWEISHLGGHRFAPTALRFPDGLALARLDAKTAHAALDGKPVGAASLRGRFGKQAPEQVAEIAVHDETGQPLVGLAAAVVATPSGVGVSETRAMQTDVAVRNRSGQHWRVTLESNPTRPRLASCTKEPATAESWSVCDLSAMEK